MGKDKPVLSPAVRKKSKVITEPEPEKKQDLVPDKVRIVPTEQLQLDPSELTKEVTRILRAENPHAPKNVVRFSHKERQYKMEASVEQTSYHLVVDPKIIHKDSTEARAQLHASEEAAHQAQQEQSTAAANAAMQAMDAAAGGDGDGAESSGTGGVENTRGLRNQFNFSERAAQTFNNPKRERLIETEPPAVADLCEIATPSIIFDAYTKDLEEQARAKEKAAGKSGPKFDKKKDASSSSSSSSAAVGERQEDVVHSAAMSRVLKFAERMVNQNTFDDVALDFAYWEDDSDRFREEGTLLPLWHFRAEKGRKKTVTCIAWNPEFPDLFAVGYGSYDFAKPCPTGVICCFSLKNPSYPEYVFTTDSGVMCLDFHPQHASLLAVGLYDGTVMIFDVRAKINKPIFQSTIKTSKHTDPVWQVHWQAEDLAKNLNFFSVSSDGRVTNWTLSKNELQYTNVMELKLNSASNPAADASLIGLAGGCCFDFNRISGHLFLVGTEEGRIHKCSKAYNSQYLETYDGHRMAVYGVKWNPFHPGVFLSCSADWTVKLWEHTNRFPVMTFDLGNAVGDIAWSPYSSTVFAAITDDGKVVVFDLAENKHEPLCEQQVVKKSKLTHIAFNPKHPVLLVGDDKGTINSLKLSPNLRKPLPAPEGSNTLADVQTQRLEALLVVAEKPEV